MATPLRFIAALIAALAALLGSYPSRADPRDGAERLVQSFATRASSAMLTLTDRDDVEHAFIGIMRDTFNVAAQARLALGPHWKEATPEQRVVYTALFERHMVRTYMGRVETFGRNGLVITGAHAAGPAVVIVDSEVRPSDRAASQVRWILEMASDGTLRIMDVSADEISVLAMQRAELTSLVARKGGIAGMIAELASRYEQR